MPNFPIASDEKVQEISDKIGSSTDSANATGTTGFALWKWLVATWTAARATKIDNLDATVSSRAASADIGTPATAASTTVNTTNAMMAYAKGAISQLASLVSSIATIKSDVASIKSSPPSVIKSIQRGTLMVQPVSSNVATLSTSVTPAKCVVILRDNGMIGGNYTLSTTSLTIQQSTNSVGTFYWQVVEFN